MPLSRSRKAGTEAAGFSFEPKTLKASSWITADVKMKQYVAMGKKIQSFSQLSVIRCGAIEVSYYESKTFWPLEEYRVWSRNGMERLINLECMVYSAMKLLPYSDESFSGYQKKGMNTWFGVRN